MTRLMKAVLSTPRPDAAGLVSGARAPIILTRRADPAKVGTASAALAKLIAAEMPPIADIAIERHA